MQKRLLLIYWIYYDFETFSKLSLVSKSLSGSESLVPAYQNQIKFLGSLYPYVLEL